eukprot:evm.model.NODE_7819_length_9746_cov_31.462240.1
MILDRAGLVGNDGPTHHGSFDLSYLGALPDIVIMAPSDEVELMNLLETAYETNDLPSVVGLLSVGTRLLDAVQAAREIEKSMPGVSVTVADARFVKPLDKEMIASLARENDVLITIEENSVGGFGSFVQQFMLEEGLMDGGRLRLRSMVLPDKFIEAGPQSDQYDQAGLAAHHIVEKAAGLVQGAKDGKILQQQQQQQLQQQQQGPPAVVPAAAGVGMGKSSRQGTSFQVLP